ncbi:MAG: hypothetical protein ACPGED_10445, partial [Flavobacteriales bacterium]
VETCSWATGPNFQLGSQSVLSNNVWQIQNGGGLDLNGSCYLNIQSQGTASVTELVLNNLNLPNQALTISFDFGLQGTQNTQANLKLVMIPQGNNPQELWVLPLQDDDDFQNGPQHMEIPIPGNAQGATFLWVFEDQTQAPAGEVQVGIDNIRIQQLPDEPEPCELLYYDSNGNPNSLPFYLSLIISPPEPTGCDLLGSIKVTSDGTTVYEHFAQGVTSTDGMQVTEVVFPIYDVNTNTVCVYLIQYFYYNACDDGDPCTIDTCEEDGCLNTPKCDDGDPCTNDFCDPETGECSHTPAWDISVLDPPAAQACYDFLGSVVTINGVPSPALSSLPSDFISQPDGYAEVASDGDECLVLVHHYYAPRVCDSPDPCVVGYCDNNTNQCVFMNSGLAAQYTVTHETCNNNGGLGTIISGGVPPYSAGLLREQNGGYNGAIAAPVGGAAGNYGDLDKGMYQITITDSRGCTIVHE